MIIKTLLKPVILLLLPLGLLAQETTSEIVGSISDGKNPLTGATITVVNVPTGTQSATTSRNGGRYNLPNLRVGGPYTITVSYVGFEKSKKEEVYLSLGQEFKADFILAPTSSKLNNVTVTAIRQNNVINSNRTGSRTNHQPARQLW